MTINIFFCRFRKKQSADDQSVAAPCKTVEDKLRGRFVAVTQYVNRYTDIEHLLRRHFAGSNTNSSCLSKLESTATDNAEHNSDTFVHCPSKHQQASDSSDKATDEPECTLRHEQNSSVTCPKHIAIESIKPACHPEMNLPEEIDGQTESIQENGFVMEAAPLNYMIVGLHACGDLTPNTLRLFVEQPNAGILCNVGCCYHHLSETFIRSPYEKGMFYF